MRYILITMLLVLAGCAGSNADLLAAASQCQTNTPGNCEEEWAAWNKAEDQKIAREEWDAKFSCSEGLVYWCGDEMCRRRRPPNRALRSVDLAHSGCITHGQMKRNLEAMMR